MEKFFQLFKGTLLPLAILILIGYFFIKTPTDLLTWNLVLFIIAGALGWIKDEEKKEKAFDHQNMLNI